MKTNECKEKIKQTMINTYGVEYISQLSYIKEQIQKTNLQKYGTKCSLQSEIVKTKQLKQIYKNMG